MKHEDQDHGTIRQAKLKRAHELADKAMSLVVFIVAGIKANRK